MLVEGQGYFVQPNETSHNLPLDPYEAVQSFVLFCIYNESGATPTYMYRKDGVSISPRLLPNQGIIIEVPNGDYTPSVEGTYTCSVTVNGTNRGSRDTIVSLPGMFCTCNMYVSHILNSQGVAIYQLELELCMCYAGACALKFI